MARQAAIEELQKKRDEKRQENQRKAEEELVSTTLLHLGKQGWCSGESTRFLDQLRFLGNPPPAPPLSQH